MHERLLAIGSEWFENKMTHHWCASWDLSIWPVYRWYWADNCCSYCPWYHRFGFQCKTQSYSNYSGQLSYRKYSEPLDNFGNYGSSTQWATPSSRKLSWYEVLSASDMWCGDPSTKYQLYLAQWIRASVLLSGAKSQMFNALYWQVLTLKILDCDLGQVN